MKKFRWNWLYFAFIVCLAVFIPFIIVWLCALGNPLAFNWRADNLRGQAADAYLKTPEMLISVIFGLLAFFFLLGLFLDVLLRKKASHIAVVLLGQGLIVAYCIARMAYCFPKGSTNVIVGVFYLFSMLGALASAYFYLKKAWDGDNLWPYWAAFLWSLAFFLFGSMTQSSYSIFNMNAHQGDLTYWLGVASSRSYIMVMAFCLAVNAKYDFFPAHEAEKPEVKGA